MEGQGNEKRGLGLQLGLLPQDISTENPPVHLQETALDQPRTTTIPESSHPPHTRAPDPLGVMADVLRFLENSRKEAQENQNRFMEALLTRVAPTTSQPARRVSLGDFLQTRPSTFAKAADPLDASDWLVEIEKKLDIVGCSDTEKVRYASHQLTGPAATWWLNYNRNCVSEQPITWAEFKLRFIESHVLTGQMELKKREFRALTQGGKKMIEYLSQFNELSRYAPADIDTEEKKIEKFLDGMHPYLKMLLAIHKIAEFEDLVNRAIILENEHSNLTEERRKKAKTDHRPSPTQRSRPHIHQQPSPQYGPPRPRPFNPSFQTPIAQQQSVAIALGCAKCGRSHLTKDCLRGTDACFHCGKSGHRKVDCPHQQRTSGTPPQPSYVSRLPAPAPLQINCLNQPRGNQPVTGGVGRGGPACLTYVTVEQIGEATYVITVPGGNRVRVFSYSELGKATHDFSGANKIGEGGFGSVFRGRLKDGTIVAVKVLSADSRQGIPEFITELMTISDIMHENLITLVGCCAEGSHRILVYNYLENNSLAHTLLGSGYSSIRFNWRARVKIAVGVARGLTFLHEEIRPPIIHRDIKASNILLDKDLTPKISDFGLARLLPPNATHVSTRVAGTMISGS